MTRAKNRCAGEPARKKTGRPTIAILRKHSKISNLAQGASVSSARRAQALHFGTVRLTTDAPVHAHGIACSQSPHCCWQLGAKLVVPGSGRRVRLIRLVHDYDGFMVGLCIFRLRAFNLILRCLLAFTSALFIGFAVFCLWAMLTSFGSRGFMMVSSVCRCFVFFKTLP